MPTCRPRPSSSITSTWARRRWSSAAGLQYETERREDAFRRPFAELEPLDLDYLKKNLRVKVRGGKTYNFTTKDGTADELLRFQQRVEAARKRR